MTDNPGRRFPLVPENAPFDEEQRAWLNGFLAGVLGLNANEARTSSAPASPGGAAAALRSRVEQPAVAPDSGTVVPDTLERRLLTVLAQLDCGKCGYSCQGYAQALASGSESDTSLCAPGAANTREALNALLSEAGLSSPALSGSARARAARAPVDSGVRPIRDVPQLPELPGSEGAQERRRAQRLRVKSHRRLTLADAGSEIREVVLDLSGSDLSYRPGDSLAIFPHNDPDLVRSLLRALGARGQELVSTPQGPCEVWRCLLENVDITHVREETLRLYAASAQDAEAARPLRELCERGVPHGFDLLDLINMFPGVRPGVEQVVSTLGVLEPRLYSIASSPSAHPKELHLAVRVVRRERAGRERKGVASAFLTEGVFKGDDLAAALHSSERYIALETSVPLILLGAGTGVARHRSFLEELGARGRRGNTWLILASCFEGDETLYQSELETWTKDGVLEHLDVIKLGQRGRRTGPHDILRRRARRVVSWLERGAAVYACGESRAFSGALNETLVEVLGRQGNRTPSEAADFLHGMRRDGRYVEEVY
ncbi:MAG TPA: (Fe-S)-binding protein [Polyangiaceae bacterium]|nr:(Fe-S)-binding protein [Polyangiaceae bacterium]